MILRVNRMKDNSKIAIAAIISGAALETAMVISALPIKNIRQSLRMSLRSSTEKLRVQ